MLRVICKHSLLLVATTTDNSFPHSSDCKNMEADQDSSESTKLSKKNQNKLPKKLNIKAIKRPRKPGGSRIKKRPIRRGGSREKTA